MPGTIQEQAGDALRRAGQQLAEAETGVRAAIAGLNQAIDAAHAAGTGPRYARAMVNSGAHLGALGRAYLNREIRSWNDIYENGPRPASQNDSELLDLHARPRPRGPAFSAGRASSVFGALARAGQELARAETGFDMAYARFGDACDFARYARIPAGRAASLVTALSGPLAETSREIVAAEVDDWDAIPLDLASELADGTEPPRFWAAAADARAAKGAGDYGAAAASWTLARDQLPRGHLLRDGLDSLISALHSAGGTGQHVTRAGYIVHHSTEPPSSWTTGQLVEAVRRHAAGLGDDKQALREVLDGWTDGAIAAAFDAARDPGEAVARTCLFATFERAGQRRAQAQAPSGSGPAGSEGDAAVTDFDKPLSEPGAEEPSVRAKKAHTAGEPYTSRSGHPWQEWLVTMEDGTQRRTSVPASGGGSGPRAARGNAEEGPWRDLSQPTYRESAERALRESRRPASAGQLAAEPAAAWRWHEALEAARAPAPPQDETARILAEYGTPDKRCSYALMEAGRRKREAYAAARSQYGTAGETAAARHRYDAAYEAAHAGWTADVAAAVAAYASDLGATPPASPGSAGTAAPYSQGWDDGASMLMSRITRRPGGYDDGQWREYLAGYAESARLHAEATAAYSRAVQQLPHEHLAGPPLRAAPAGRPGAAAGPGQGAAGPDFPGPPAACPAGLRRPGRPSAGTAPATRQARPGRLP